MTSGNSSLVKFINEQRAMIWRRLPLAALAVLVYFIYDVFGLTDLTIYKTGLHTRYRLLRKYALGLFDLNLRKLGCIFPKGLG